MLLPFLATLLALSAVPTDTTVTLGTLKRDLTWDGVSEVLSLTGTGATIDRLSVTFTIQSSGRTLYSKTWNQMRADFDGPRKLSDLEFQTRIDEFSREFFDDSKFMSPEGFVSWLRQSAPLHIALIPEVISHQLTPHDSSLARMVWEQMKAANITVFEFSPGGDSVMVIAWSTTHQRFYDLLECC